MPCPASAAVPLLLGRPLIDPSPLWRAFAIRYQAAMRRYLPVALLALFTAAAPAASATDQAPAKLLTWPDLLKRPRPQPDATISYGPYPRQKIDVWRPAGHRWHHVVVMIHGGCWTTGIADRSIMNWIADDLRRHGIGVWNIDYRGVDLPGGGYPGTFRDVAAAVDALRKHGDDYRLDREPLVVIGHSAGGHLALWLAGRKNLAKSSPLRDGNPLKIKRVISLGGLPDLAATAASPDNGCGTAVVAQLVGTPGSRRDIYADTSVPRLLPLHVPQDLVNGREDRIIPFRLATDYVAMARKAGDRADLNTVPATGHVELIAPESAAWAEARRLVLAAIKR